MTEYLLTPEEIVFELNCSKGIVDTYDSNILQASEDVAQAQLAKCEEKAKPVWQREAVEMVFERIERLWQDCDYICHIPLQDYQSLKQEILDKIGGEK